MYRIYKKILGSYQRNLKKNFEKVVYFSKILDVYGSFSWSLPDDEGGITCMY